MYFILGAVSAGPCGFANELNPVSATCPWTATDLLNTSLLSETQLGSVEERLTSH